MNRAPRWKVYVVSPRPNTREKVFYLLARLREPSGRILEEHRCSTGTADRAEAERRRAMHEMDLNAGEVGVGAGQDPTVLAVFDARILALEADPDIAPNTTKGYRFTRTALASCSLATVPASKLDRAAILRARDELKAGRKASTVNQYFAHTAAAWRWARERELVATDWPPVKRLKAKPTEKRPFTDAEVVAILDWLATYLRGRWLPLFALLADSSERIGATLKLRGRDVSFERCEIAFRRTKTTPTWRAIPPETMALMPKREPDELLFPGIRRGRPVRPESVRDVLIRAMRAVGVQDPTWLSVHSFRRSWIKTSQDERIPVPVAMKHTGHTDMKVFQGYMRNSVGDDMHEAAGRVHAARERARTENRGQGPQARPRMSPLASPPKSTQVKPSQRAQLLTS